MREYDVFRLHLFHVYIHIHKSKVVEALKDLDVLRTYELAKLLLCSELFVSDGRESIGKWYMYM